MPCNYIERRMILFVLKLLPLETGHDGPLFFTVLIPSDRSLEIAFICESIRPNGAEVGNGEVSFVYFADPAS